MTALYFTITVIEILYITGQKRYHGMKNASPKLKLQTVPPPYRPTHQTDIKLSLINFKIDPLLGM